MSASTQSARKLPPWLLDARRIARGEGPYAALGWPARFGLVHAYGLAHDVRVFGVYVTHTKPVFWLAMNKLILTRVYGQAAHEAATAWQEGNQ